MLAYQESVSDESRPECCASDRDSKKDPLRMPKESVLLVGLNWLGDNIMAMPAVQAWRRVNPEVRLVVLVKPKCRDIWMSHSAVDEVVVCSGAILDAVRVARVLRAERFRAAFVLPNSFRSALVPFFAGISRRTGVSGHGRRWLLTEVIKHEFSDGKAHQCYEYMKLLSMPETSLATPELSVSAELIKRARCLIGDVASPKIAIIPGAAYGDSKRWPVERFVETGKMLRDATGGTILVLGSEAEREVCHNVANTIGDSAIDLSARTSLPELAAVLSLCSLAVTNDSGGMHLAAAVKTPVVAVFGITDPLKTGPLGDFSRVLQDSDVRSRDLKRSSAAAEAALRKITAQQVFDEAMALMLKFEGDNASRYKNNGKC